MEAGRSRARSCVQELVSAWIAGDYDTVSHRCTPDVCWWTPLSGEPVSGLANTLAELERVLRPVRTPIDVTAVVLDEPGTRCVVEMRAAADAGGPPSFITTVVTLRDGMVSAGRTYLATLPLDRTAAVTACRRPSPPPSPAGVRSSPGPPAISAPRSRGRWLAAGPRPW